MDKFGPDYSFSPARYLFLIAFESEIHV